MFRGGSETKKISQKHIFIAQNAKLPEQSPIYKSKYQKQVFAKETHSFLVLRINIINSYLYFKIYPRSVYS